MTTMPPHRSASHGRNATGRGLRSARSPLPAKGERGKGVARVRNRDGYRLRGPTRPSVLGRVACVRAGAVQREEPGLVVVVVLLYLEQEGDETRRRHAKA